MCPNFWHHHFYRLHASLGENSYNVFTLTKPSFSLNKTMYSTVIQFITSPHPRANNLVSWYWKQSAWSRISIGHGFKFFKKLIRYPLIVCHYMSGMMCKNFIWFRWKFENPKSIMCFGWSACRIMIHTPPARRNELIYSPLRSLQQLFLMYFSCVSHIDNIQ